MIELTKNWRWLAGIVVISAVAAFLLTRDGADGAVPSGQFETVFVDLGPINQTVATSGSVRPLVTVQVGSQLSGQVAELFADFNSEVSKGDLIARIDPQTFQTRVEAARAEKAVASASLTARRADFRRAEAFVTQRESDLDRYESLGEDAGIAEIELDAIRAQYRAAVADLDAARAQIVNAEATVVQRSASMRQAELDLERTQIRSPIDGVVILRSVDVGQTVAASLSAPVLFEIAQDLSNIQIEADVNEADIGAVTQGNPVSFTVDAYPGRRFSGRVETVRLAPNELQNVVTYTVIIHAENPGRVLYPGMTATLEIITGQRANALRIPNAAARFEPDNAAALLAQNGEGNRRQGGGGRMAALAEQLELSVDQQKELQSRTRELFSGSAGSGNPRAGDRRKRMNSILKSILTEEQWKEYQAGEKDRSPPKTIWILDENGKVAPRRVRLGIADTSYIEIVDGRLQAGDAVIIRENKTQS